MLWLGGLYALDLTTSTPDALCPPLEEARAAVKARVGEVRGDFHAEFGLIRRDDGSQALTLVLREGAEPVLRRELPLDEAGCEDAAQAIALVLERHFDAIERPDPAEAAPKLESVPSTTDRAASQVVPATTAIDPPSIWYWRARGGLLYDAELGLAPTVGVTLYPRALKLGAHVRIGAALDVAAFALQRPQTIRDQDITLTTLQAALSLPFTVELPTLELSVGPWAQWRFQRGAAPTQLHGEPGYRALPGVGGFAQVTGKLGPRWSLAAGTALGAQLPDSSARFVLQKDNGQRDAVLVPESWFAQAQLAAVLAF